MHQHSHITVAPPALNHEKIMLLTESQVVHESNTLLLLESARILNVRKTGYLFSGILSCFYFLGMATSIRSDVNIRCDYDRSHPFAIGGNIIQLK